MSISSFYDNKKILITGVTGFVGKVLLEKFLWSLPNTDKFFLLIRNKVKKKNKYISKKKLKIGGFILNGTF